MPDPHRTDPHLVVLHALRCIGATSADRAAEATGLPRSEAEALLVDLVGDGLVKHTEGSLGGWGLTEDGRAADAERIAADLDTAGAREAVRDAFDRFVALNAELLDVCTAWQLRKIGSATELNDHTDPAYDGRVLDRLSSVHRRATPILNDLSAWLTRFASYGPRLAAALDRADAGDVSAVADGTSSYHAVWFQLHEDLLVTLGIERWTDG